MLIKNNVAGEGGVGREERPGVPAYWGGGTAQTAAEVGLLADDSLAEGNRAQNCSSMLCTYLIWNFWVWKEQIHETSGNILCSVANPDSQDPYYYYQYYYI